MCIVSPEYRVLIAYFYIPSPHTVPDEQAQRGEKWRGATRSRDGKYAKNHIGF